MNFDEYDTTFNGERTTVLVKLVADAIEKDIKSQQRRISRSKYNQWIHAAHRLSNSNALRYGHAIGNKIINGTPLAKGNSYIKGSDLAKIVYYCFFNEGLLEWYHLGELISTSAKCLAPLSDVKPLDSSNIVDKVGVVVNGHGFGSSGFAAELRRLADQIEPLEAIKNELSVKARRQSLTIVNQSNVIMEQREKLEKNEKLVARFKESAERLRAGVAKEKDAKKKEQMMNELQMIERIAENIK
jgi:hypothetical protein